jgi:hypothetical protein
MSSQTMAPPPSAPACPRAQKPAVVFRRRLGKNGLPKQMSREMRLAFDRALPELGGQGDYWRGEVEAGRAEYPPLPTVTPPRACRRFGDRGRLYPNYYVSNHTPPPKRVVDPDRPWTFLPPDLRRKPRPRRACEDCRQIMVLEAERRLYNESGYLRQDGSPSAAGIQAAAEAGVQVEELKLEAEDVPTLKRQIAKYEAAVAAKKTVTIKPFEKQ